MDRRSSGFTLIELLIVIGILGVLAAVLLPSARQSQQAANVELDAAQLRQHFVWLQLYAAGNNKGLPAAGGHRFVLATWSVTGQTAEDLDRYFTPGARDNDAHYQALRKRLLRGERIWQDLADCTHDDTTYCGRDAQHVRTAFTGANEALMANSNNGMWTHPNGTVNVLMSSGHVRSLGHALLRELYEVPEFDVDEPIRTWGGDSPIPECRRLAR